MWPPPKKGIFTPEKNIWKKKIFSFILIHKSDIFRNSWEIKASSLSLDTATAPPPKKNKKTGQIPVLEKPTHMEDYTKLLLSIQTNNLTTVEETINLFLIYQF